MEIQKIKHFLRPLLILSNGDGNGYGDGNGNGDGNGYGDGNGNGDGNGYGYGNGNGDGNGYGYGNGNGYGNGDGNGYGYGNGYGIKKLNKQTVYLIDNIQTIIQSVSQDVAKGFIINNNVSLDSCYIVRNDYFFSHGKTLKEAIKSLQEKTILNLPVEKRIENFKNQFKNFSKKYKAQLLYDWHYKLTGSCKMGRDNFIQNHNIDLKKDLFTINDFIKLTENSYGSEIIKKLKTSKKWQQNKVNSFKQ